MVKARLGTIEIVALCTNCFGYNLQLTYSASTPHTSLAFVRTNLRHLRKKQMQINSGRGIVEPSVTIQNLRSADPGF